MMAAEGTMSEANNKLLARRLLEEVVNTGDVHRLAEFVAPDYVERHADVAGIEGARQHILTFHRCYPDLHVTVEGQVAEDDIVVTWFTMRGTHWGEWGGIKPTNKVLTLRGVNVQKFRDGRIVEQWGGANTLEALLEIGAIRLPGDASD
jgi:predicted ester cyclase